MCLEWSCFLPEPLRGLLADKKETHPSLMHSLTHHVESRKYYRVVWEAGRLVVCWVEKQVDQVPLSVPIPGVSWM